jgi:cytochrome c biogenesis protein CcdA/thiol-disulfide isomerase/thioredoxin
MILLFISFTAGILTVLAPCILPLLPIIVGGTLSDGGKEKFNKKKALIIILSLGISILAFTLLLKASTIVIDIPEYVWKWISGSIVIFLGLVTIFPSIWENRLITKLNIKSNILLGKGDQKKSMIGDIIVGAALGPVFSTCSPTYFIVLATVLPINLFLGLIYLITYIIGLGLSLFVISIIGQRIMNKLDVVANPKGWFKKTLGIIFLIVGVAIISGLDKKTQLFLLDAGLFDVTKIEQKLLQGNTPRNTNVSLEQSSSKKESDTYFSIEQKQTRYENTPELSSIDGYINTNNKPITLAELKGKVVLLDIWTYSCINCQRTLPYINDWYTKYKDQGLVVVGLHTPEFAFEKIQSNVEKAVEKFGIKYPVVLDNDYSTWNALGNQFWPRKYLIDIDGYIVYDHIGEGNYGETEKAIQYALKERIARIGIEDNISTTTTTKPSNLINIDSSKVGSPETYFGSARNQYLANGRAGISGEQTLIIPQTIYSNKLYLDGVWNMTSEYAENKNEGSIVFNYEAKNVYITAGSEKGVEIEIYKDNIFIKRITIKDETLYSLIQDIDYGKHTLRIVIPKSGLKAFTFTFG